MCLLLSLKPLPTEAQGIFGIGELVWDPTNYVENAATAASTFETMLQAIELVKHALTNLEPLGAFAIDASGGLSIIAELEALAAFFSGVRQGISLMDPAAAREMFEALYPITPETVPCTSTAAAEWVPVKREQRWLAAGDATSAQGFAGQLVVMAGRVAALIDQLKSIIGNLQGHQVTPQVTATLTTGQAYMQLFHATYSRVETSKTGDAASSQASLDCIIDKISEDMPRAP